MLVANCHLSKVSSSPYVGDCRSALKLISEPDLHRAPRFKWAGMSREMAMDGLCLVSARWVKAHQTSSPALSDQQNADVLRNEFVDIKAKAAANTVRISDGELDAYINAFRSVKAVIRAAARMLALWPSNFDLYGKLTMARAKAPIVKEPLAPHTYMWNGKCWVCVVCLRRKFSDRSTIDAISCTSLTSVITSILKEPNGHSLLLTATVSGQPLIFCGSCGYHASVAKRHLGKPCKGKVHPRPASLVSIFGEHSRHPHTKELLTHSYHASVACTRFAEQSVNPGGSSPPVTDDLSVVGPVLGLTTRLSFYAPLDDPEAFEDLFEEDIFL